jgi:hypothetical protein
MMPADCNEALAIWRDFIQQPGAFVDGTAGIASPHSLATLLRLLTLSPKSPFLEIGAGIGTMTLVLARHLAGRSIAPTHTLHSVESNDFCLGRLAENVLPNYGDSVRFFDSTADLPGGDYGLVVVDGGGSNGNDLGFQDLSAVVGPRCFVLVEGGRSEQVSHLRAAYAGRSPLIVRSTPSRTVVATPSGIAVKNKGCTVLFFEPDASARTLAIRLSLEDLVARALRRIRRVRNG